jgi:hypothetical protein
MTETSVALQNLFQQYSCLPLGGKEIVCPYWMNKLVQGIYGPNGGKGNPEQIVQATVEEAKNAFFDLNKASEEEILAFMRTRRIGVDCSGFVYWMLDAFDREKGGNGLADDIPEANGSFVGSRANVRLLTSKELATRVSLQDVRVGDMIRTRGGKHIMIVFSIERDDDGNLWKITYAHSSNKTEITGVHLGVIDIVAPEKTLADQIWQEKNADGDSYLVDFLPEAGDGFYRLLLFNK